MAGIMQNKCFKYFTGKEPEDAAVHVLLVSTSQLYLDEIQKNLFITRQVQSDKRPYNLKVHICKHISDVIASKSTLRSDDFTTDFIVFVVDVKNANCLSEVQSNLNLLDSSFGREKICIINPNPTFDKSIVDPFALWEFAHRFQINIINGRINDPERITNLSKRILNLVESCCGIINGIPLIGYV